MTDQQQHDPSESGERVRVFRDQFGDALVSAARRRERRKPRRRLVAGFATAAVAAAGILVTTAVLSPGERSTPLLGASPAEAAVQELTRSLRSGVLIRVAHATQHSSDGTERHTESDWTDLATRDRRTRIVGDRSNYEFWNTSAHERWTVDESLRAPDGRRVVEHHTDRGSENSSASASPIEEIEKLRDLAAGGELSLRRETGADGTVEVVLEQRQKCLATRNLGMMECPTADTWPDKVPEGMKAVTNFQTWWLQDGDEPRLLRHENGAIQAGTARREVVYRVRYSRWDVLPATPSNLALVQPPAFPDDRYLEVDGPEAVGDGVRAGRIICRGSTCPS